MCYDVVKVNYIEGYKLEVVFENGERGVVDFTDYIKKGGVFDSLADINYFKQFYINKDLGVLCWPNEVDISPEVLYHEATGKPLPDWIVLSENTGVN